MVTPLLGLSDEPLAVIFGLQKHKYRLRMAENSPIPPQKPSPNSSAGMDPLAKQRARDFGSCQEERRKPDTMKEEQSRKRRRGKNMKPQKTQPSLLPKHSTKLHKKTHQQKNPAHQSSSSSSSLKSSSFLDKMKARLAGGHFRMINEKLYTCTGKEALDYFKEDPELFDMYHTGYQEQMSHWPELPVNIIIKWLKERSSSLIVADFGCGDARLAKNVKNKVFSIDLVSNDPSVISCDMSNTPLSPSSVDVAVFCLSLMGTNYASYLKEACRVLKPSGWLLIAEVKSRFDPNNGGADPNMFSKAVCEMGFNSALKDFSNKMFVLLYFKKKENQSSNGREIEWPELKPCIYKRR